MKSSSGEKVDANEQESVNYWPVKLVCGVFLLFVIIVLWRIGGLPGTPAAIGQFGDAFGVLSSLFNGLAFAGLIITIVLQSRQLELQRNDLRLQQEEMRATRAEFEGQKSQLEYQSFAMAKQNFEDTFFAMLQMIDERASQLPDAQVGDLGRRGRSGFTAHVTQLYRVEAQIFENDELTFDQAKLAYAGWFRGAAPELMSHFQLVHQTVKFVDATTVPITKAGYIAILRAALSPAEQHLIFYHAILGERVANFAELMARHNFFQGFAVHGREKLLTDRLAWYPPSETAAPLTT